MDDQHNMTPADPGQGHDKPLCGGRRRDGSGETCRRPAGWGTDHVGTGACKLHGGATTNHRKAAQLEQARRDVDRFGGSIEVDPATALLQEVYRSAGTVEYLRLRVNELQQDEIVWGVVKESAADGQEYRAAPSVWVQLYAQERKHHAQVCKAALDAGATATIVDVFRQVGATYVGVVRRVLDRVLAAVDLSEEQRGRVPELLRAALEMELDGIGAGSVGGGEAA